MVSWPKRGTTPWDTPLKAYLDGSFASKTATETALTPGDPGDLKATVGGVITNIKPGRIDARVRGLSTTESAGDNKTLFDALATEAGAGGHELWVPDGTYNLDDGRVASNARVAGTGTIQATSANGVASLRVINGVENVEITGLTFDGGGLASGIQVGSSAIGTLAESVHIHHCRFTNTGTTGTHTRAGVRGVGGRKVVIEKNHFDAVDRAVDLWNPVLVTVRGNIVETTTDNMVFVQWDSNMQEDGTGCQIIGNIGSAIGRMGVELWSIGGATVVRDGLVALNEIYTTGVSMGISSVTVRGINVIDNILRSPNATAGVGIEMVAPGQTVARNRIYGFLYGMTITSIEHADILENTITGANDGLHIVGTGTGTRHSTVARNRLIDTISTGMRISTSTNGSTGWLDVTENRILRMTTQDDDDSRTFIGISIGSLDGFSRFSRNRIVQGIASPTAGYGFEAFRYAGSAGNLKFSEFHGNILEDMSESLTSTMFAESTSSAADDADLSGNKQIASDGTVSAVSDWS